MTKPTVRNAITTGFVVAALLVPTAGTATATDQPQSCVGANCSGITLGHGESTPTSVTFSVKETYKVTSKGASLPKTRAYVDYTNGAATELTAETYKALWPTSSDSAAYMQTDIRQVEAGGTTGPIKVLSYRGERLSLQGGPVGYWSLETSLGDQGLAGLDWTMTGQPSAPYYGGRTPKGVKLRVKATTTCTVTFPFTGSDEVCGKRTETLHVKNIGRKTARKLRLETVVREYASDGGVQELSTKRKKALKPGKTWHKTVMRYDEASGYSYYGRPWPMMDDLSYNLYSRSQTVAGKYGIGASNASPWWWGVQVPVG